MVEGVKAIGTSWYEGKPLRFEGEHYQHTLMTPMFTPTDIDYGSPPILVAAVGPLMTDVAGEVGDGLIVHSFSTESFIREVTLPRVERALARSGRRRGEFRIDYAPFMVTGNSEEEFERAKESAKSQIAFYASTPAYRPVLELHGWGEVQTELHALTKQGRWEELGAVITDEILEAFAVVGEPTEVGRAAKRRFGDFVDDLSFDCENHSDETLAAVLDGINSESGA
jgi:probable F420-dependent oxidoreductase